MRDALNREKPVLTRAKNSTRARVCAGVWPAGAWARAPAHPIVYPSPQAEPAHAVWLSIAERKGQGRRRAARRVAVAACSAPWMCLFTYLPERTFSPEPRNASKVQSTHYTRGKYSDFVRFRLRASRLPSVASAVGAWPQPSVKAIF